MWSFEKKHGGYILRLLALLSTLAFALWLGSIAHENEAVQELLLSGGYLGILLFSIINGFNVFVPVVTASFIPALTTAGLNVYVSLFLVSLGMTIADCTAYFLARVGHGNLSRLNVRVTRSIEFAEKRSHSLPLWILGFWALFVPLPSEVVLIPLGLLGYPPRLVLPIVIIGNIVFNTIVVFGLIGFFGV